MSDKLKGDFDIYYTELRNVTDRFKRSSHAVPTDRRLSEY